MSSDMIHAQRGILTVAVVVDGNVVVVEDGHHLRQDRVEVRIGDATETFVVRAGALVVVAVRIVAPQVVRHQHYPVDPEKVTGAVLTSADETDVVVDGAAVVEEVYPSLRTDFASLACARYAQLASPFGLRSPDPERDRMSAERTGIRAYRSARWPREVDVAREANTEPGR